jgi:hypothetical protein
VAADLVVKLQNRSVFRMLVHVCQLILSKLMYFVF